MVVYSLVIPFVAIVCPTQGSAKILVMHHARRGAAWLFGLAVASWIGIHAVAGQKPTHSWYDWVIYAAILISLFMFLATTEKIRASVSKKPKLTSGDVRSFRRSANASRETDDLEVVYAKIRNDQDGGGERATIFDAEAWMEAIDDDGNTVARCQGNWINLRAGSPGPTPMKSATLLPSRALILRRT
jgi:hypothetical protein